MENVIKELALPEGWTYEKVDHNCIELCMPAPDLGRVTIDFDKRAFSLGGGLVIRPATNTKYGGRGWAKQIVKDAIEHLQQVYRD